MAYKAVSPKGIDLGHFGSQQEAVWALVRGQDSRTVSGWTVAPIDTSGEVRLLGPDQPRAEIFMGTVTFDPSLEGKPLPPPTFPETKSFIPAATPLKVIVPSEALKGHFEEMKKLAPAADDEEPPHRIDV